MGKTTITSIACAVTVAAVASLFSPPAAAGGTRSGGHGGGMAMPGQFE